ncbi:MAG: RDD family protein [Thermoanaerobaculia bacterium]|nr:RDD family protein [Thermoanaerobaculia bacterium]
MAWLLPALSAFGLFGLYFPLFEYRFGKTPFKQVMRLRVMRESHAPIGLGIAFVRRLSLYLELLWLDGLFVFFTDKRQRALDVVARTIVVEEPEERRHPMAGVLCLTPWMILVPIIFWAVVFEFLR